MKKFKHFIAGIAVFALLSTSCSKDDENLTNSGSEKATLSFGTVLNDLVSKQSALKQQLGNIPECSDDLPAFVEVVISQEGVAVVGTVANPFKVNVNPNSSDYNGDGAPEYFTDESASLELESGIYSLEYFQVLNEEEEVIWIAPIEDEENENFAGFVDKPLPFEFILESGEKKYLDVEVLCFDDRLLNYYGYLFFDIEGAEAIEFCVFGNYCDETGRHVDATRYSVNVWDYSGDPENPQGDVLYTDLENILLAIDYEDSGVIVATPLCIALPDREGLDEYYFEIILLQNGPQLIRSGVITDEDVRELFDGEDNLDYYHFREGNCNLEDSPGLFETSENPPASLAGTTWDFHYLHNEEQAWHADVTFYEDGTVFYTEPADPGVFDYWGTWSQNGKYLYYDMKSTDNNPLNYVLTGTIHDGNNMSGIYTFGNENKRWVAVKHD